MTEASEVPFGLEVTRGVLAKFLMAAIGFVGTIIFARILGPVAFGGFYLVLSVVQIAKLPVDGFGEAAKKRFSETAANRRDLTGAMLFLGLGVAIVAILLASLAERQLVAFTGLPDAVFLFTILFLAISLFTPFQGMLAGTGRVSLTIWVDLLRTVLTMPLQLAFVLLGYGAAGMAYGLSLATALTIPATQYFLASPPKLPDRHTFQRLWSFARYSTISVTFGRAYNRFDIILLGLLLAPGAAGQYEVAFKLTIPAVLLSEVAGEGLMARVSNLRSKGEAVAEDVTNTLMFASILAIPIFFGTAVLSRQLVVTIYGPAYAAAASLLVGLALFRVFETQAAPLMQAINGLDRPDVNVRIAGVTLLINIILGVVLTIQLGAIGVVIATVVAEGTKYAMAAFVVAREVATVEFLPRTLLEQFGAGVVMAGAVVAAHQLIPVRSWLHLLVLVGLGAAVYVATVLAVSEALRLTTISILADAGLVRYMPFEIPDR